MRARDAARLAFASAYEIWRESVMVSDPDKGLGLVLNTSQAAHDYFMRWFPFWGMERFISVGVDERFRVVSVQQKLGGARGVASLSFDEVFGRAKAAGAVRVIICHNHPGPAVEPSSSDSDTTERMRRHGESLGVRLWDHLIIHKSLRFSFRIKGSLGDREPASWCDMSEVERESLCWERRKWGWSRRLLGEWKLVW